MAKRTKKNRGTGRSRRAVPHPKRYQKRAQLRGLRRRRRAVPHPKSHQDRAVLRRRRRASKSKRMRSPSGTRRKLIHIAKQAQKMAYCPYSRYPVGAAVLTGSGRIFSGCNVENASLGLSCCAERTAIFNAVSHREKTIKSICIVARSAKPCGACRQVILEFATKDSELIAVHWDPIQRKQKITFTKISRILPQAFNPAEAGL